MSGAPSASHTESAQFPPGLAALWQVGWSGLGPYTSTSAKAWTGLYGWAFLGLFGMVVVWLAWFVLRMFLLLVATALTLLWLLYVGFLAVRGRASSAQQ